MVRGQVSSPSLSCRLGFVSEDLGMGLSTSAASSLVAHEAYAGKADSTAAVARKYLIRCWQCCSVTVLPPAPFLHEVDSAEVFKEGDGLMNCFPPGVTLFH